MTISATCPKGHTLTLEEKLAGKKIRCPRCQAVFQVPDLEDEEIEEAEAVSEKPIRRAKRRDDDDDEEEDDRPRRKARAAARDDDDDEDDDDDDDRPRGRGRAAVRDDDEDDDDEEEMDDDIRRKLEKKLKKKQLKLVDVGLLLHYIKLCIYLIGIVLAMTLGVLFAIAASQAAEAGEAAQGGGGGGGVAAFTLMGFAILALVSFLFFLMIALLGPLFGAVGSFLCSFIPKKSEAKGTIITSLIFDAICVVSWLLQLLAVTGVLGMDLNKRLNLILLLQMIIIICSVVSWLTFLTALRNMGAYLSEAALGNEALNLIARLVVQVITLILDFILIIAVGRYFVGVMIAIFIAIGSMTIWFIFFIFTFYLRQLKLVGAMRRAVQNKL